MAHPSPLRHHALVIIGLILGLASSAWMALAAHDHRLEPALPNPWQTASLGLGVIVAGWLLAMVAPRFAAAVAAGAFPGALYGALVLAGGTDRQMAYGWSAIPVALGCLALGAGLHANQSHARPWSARRSTASHVPRVKTR